MSLYNMINDMNVSLAIIVSGVLGFRIDQRFPRFRDVFTAAEDAPWLADIFVYTRMGGGNRECWGDDETDDAGNCLCPACTCDRLEKEPFIVGSYDDEFDSTYRTFGIKFTDEQRAQWTQIKAGEQPASVTAKLFELFPDLKDQLEAQQPKKG